MILTSQFPYAHFDGVDDRIELGTNDVVKFDMLDPFSVHVRFRTVSKLQQYFIGNFRGGANPGWSLWINDGKIMFYHVHKGGPESIIVQSVNDYADGKYHSALAIADGSADANNYKIIVDNTSDVEVVENNLVDSSISDQPVTIGRRPFENKSHFDGGLLQTAVYNQNVYPIKDEIFKEAKKNGGDLNKLSIKPSFYYPILFTDNFSDTDGIKNQGATKDTSDNLDGTGYGGVKKKIHHVKPLPNVGYVLGHSNDEGSIPHHNDLNIAADEECTLVIYFEIREGQSGSDTILIEKYTSDHIGWYFSINGDDSFTIRFRIQAGSLNTLSEWRNVNTLSLPVGVHQCIIRKTSSTTPGGWDVFINGEEFDNTSPYNNLKSTDDSTNTENIKLNLKGKGLLSFQKYSGGLSDDQIIWLSKNPTKSLKYHSTIKATPIYHLPVKDTPESGGGVTGWNNIGTSSAGGAIIPDSYKKTGASNILIPSSNYYGHFNGDDTYLNIGNPESLRFDWNSPFTITFWMYIYGNIEDPACIIVHDDNDLRGIVLLIYQSRVDFNHRNDQFIRIYKRLDISNLSGWNHFLFSSDGSGDGNNYVARVGNRISGSPTQNNLDESTTVSEQNWNIGRSSRTADRYIDKPLNNMAIYTSDVSDMYSKIKGKGRHGNLMDLPIKPDVYIPFKKDNNTSNEGSDSGIVVTNNNVITKKG